MESVTQETLVCESCGQVALRSDLIRKGLGKTGEPRYRHRLGVGCKAQTIEPQQEQALALVPANVHLLIDVENQRGNLANMHRASGEPDTKAPKHWTGQDQAQEFIAALAAQEKVSPDYLLASIPGRAGGSWAHWQICVEYARYLSPAFAIRWNEYARRYLEQQAYRPMPQPIAIPSPLSDIADARSAAMHVQQTANAFLQALDMAGRRGVEFGDAMRETSPSVGRFVQAMPELTHPKKAGYVYLTREPNDRRGVYKLGRSVDADKREAQIPGQMPTIVRHVKIIKTDDCGLLEDTLKLYFKAQKYGKEWYRLSDQQVAAICDLPDYFPSTRFRELPMLLATEQVIQGTLL